MESELRDVFTRNWYVWAEVKEYDYTSQGVRIVYRRKKVAGPGPKTFIARKVTRAEAIRLCAEYNDTHNPGPLSRKAEFDYSE